MDNIKKTETTEENLSRRKALSRIGLFAAAAYTVPAFTTLSMARASSGTSSTSDGGSASDGGSDTEVSTNSSGSSTSDPSSPSLSVPSEVEDICKEFGNPGDTDYDACIIENGVKLP